MTLFRHFDPIIQNEVDSFALRKKSREPLLFSTAVLVLLSSEKTMDFLVHHGSMPGVNGYPHSTVTLFAKFLG
jgi:hypothetical protein